MRPAALLLVLLACLAAGACAPAREPPRRIVLIVADTLRRDHLSCYGSNVATPQIDRLAHGGTRFAHAVSAYHQTTMSMGALFTGLTPAVEAPEAGTHLAWTGQTWCGLYRLVAPGGDEPCLPSAPTTLAEALSEAGYRTLGVVSNHLLYRPYGFDGGFDRWIEVGAMPPDYPLLAPQAVEARGGEAVNQAVFDAIDAERDARVFLYVHYMDAHDWGPFVQRDYAESVALLDRAVGELLDGLTRRGLLDDAAVLFTSDHGERLGETHAIEGRPYHLGNPSFETLLRVPLLVWPGPGNEDPRLVRSQDVFGLIARIAGLPPPAPEPAVERAERFMSELVFQTYARGRWKSMLRRDGGDLVLFDLEEDPGETRDLAAEHPQVAAEHRERIAALASALAAERAPAEGLSAEDEALLRALGYLSE